MTESPLQTADVPSDGSDTDASPPLLSVSELRAWRAFSEGGQLMEALLDRRLRARTGLSHADYGVLRRLQDSEGHQLVMKELRHAVWFSRSRLTHQINRLMVAGLVVKLDDTDDGRRQIVAMTPLGVEKVVEAQRIVRRLLREHFFDRLPAASVDVLSGILEDMVQHLRQQPECQSFRHS